MNPKPHFKAYDAQGDASDDIKLHFTNPEDQKRAREIMDATGVGSEIEAVIMVFRRYHPDFLAWWKGDKSKAPLPLTNSPAPKKSSSSSSQEEAANKALDALDTLLGFNS